MQLRKTSIQGLIQFLQDFSVVDLLGEEGDESGRCDAAVQKLEELLAWVHVLHVWISGKGTGIVDEIYFWVVLSEDISGYQLSLVVCNLHKEQYLWDVAEQAVEFDEMIAVFVDNAGLVLGHPKHALASDLLRKYGPELAIEVRIQHSSILQAQFPILDLRHRNEPIQQKHSSIHLRGQQQRKVLLHFREIIYLDYCIPVWLDTYLLQFLCGQMFKINLDYIEFFWKGRNAVDYSDWKFTKLRVYSSVEWTVSTMTTLSPF